MWHPLLEVQKRVSDARFSTSRALQRQAGRGRSKQWEPSTLRKPLLLAFLFTTLALTVTIEFATYYSEHHHGIIFASNVSELPLYRSFWYRYLPTLIAVLYSLAWSWIDLDTKRTEPWRQLSRPDGATASDSVLLQYPFEFLPLVPISSIRKKHWLVFLSSTALVLTSWAVTPLQAAIFSVQTVEQSYKTPMAVSNQRMTLEEQSNHLTATYSYSVYSIAWLNGQLPAYMTRQAALAPFQNQGVNTIQLTETWTAATTSYSVDVECEPARLVAQKSGNSTTQSYESSHGCSIPYPYGPDGTDVMDDSGAYAIKQFSAIYAGYSNHDGLADYYISSYCPRNASDVFLAGFAKNKQRPEDQATPPTVLFCKPSYYQQRVAATIRGADLGIIDYSSLGPKLPLPSGVVDTKRLEWQMNSATQQEIVRGDIPSSRWPDQNQRLMKLPISLTSGGAEIPMMAALAIGAYERVMEDYLDPDILRKSYEAAYQLLFARAMVDVLKPDFAGADVINGARVYKTQAVRVVPAFAHAVAGLLAVIAVLNVLLLILLSKARINLSIDPGSISALMRLAVHDCNMLDDIVELETSVNQPSSRIVASEKYVLETNGSMCKLRILSTTAHANRQRSHSKKRSQGEDGSMKRRWPIELSLSSGIVFLLAHMGLILALAYLYIIARKDGIALPSSNLFVRQILENYIPTAIATLMEPLWILLARLVAVLQPFEALGNGNAPAHKSVDLKYSAIPPQLVLFKALRVKHFRLAAIGSMALLANVLAVAFSGIFYEKIATVSAPINVTIPYEPLFGNVWNARANDYTIPTLDHFYTAMSNLTSGSPMPPWTDDAGFYVPFGVERDGNDTHTYQARTRGFGLDTECVPLETHGPNVWDLDLENESGDDPVDRTQTANLAIHIQDELLGDISCYSRYLELSTPSPTLYGQWKCPQDDSAIELVVRTQASGSASEEIRQFCNQTVVAAWLRSPATERCLGDRNGSVAADFAAQGSTVIACRPKIVSRAVTLTVDADNIVQHVVGDGPWSDDVEDFFRGDHSELIIEANNELLAIPYGLSFSGGFWHSDSFSSDWNNYIMQQTNASDTFLDPALPPPGPEEMVPLFVNMYKKLFASWLGLHYEKILIPAAERLGPDTGDELIPETRIFLSEPMFWLAEAILAMYVVATATLYIRRPARFLPRLPTTIASNIAMFAASRALEDFEGDCLLDKREQERMTYGYGTYLGTDRKLHAGIEKEPFVTPVKAERRYRSVFDRYPWRRKRVGKT